VTGRCKTASAIAGKLLVEQGVNLKKVKNRGIYLEISDGPDALRSKFCPFFSYSYFLHPVPMGCTCATLVSRVVQSGSLN
jgi:hypothetical protein